MAGALRRARRTHHTFDACSCKVGERLRAPDGPLKSGPYNNLTDGRKIVLVRVVSRIIFGLVAGWRCRQGVRSRFWGFSRACGALMPSCARDSIVARTVVRRRRSYYVNGTRNTLASTHAMHEPCSNHENYYSLIYHAILRSPTGPYLLIEIDEFSCDKSGGVLRTQRQG